MTTRRDELIGFLEEAHLRVSDGCRPISSTDARGVADELLFGDGSPEWLLHHPVGIAASALILARHSRSDWQDDAVESGPWGTGGWVCECGEVITSGDLAVDPSQGVPAVTMWHGRHQVAMLAKAGAL